MSSHSLPTVLCREIGDADVGSVAELLRKGFPGRTRQYWLEVFDRLRKHPAPSDMPTYGYLMESASAPVGVILLISTMMQIHDTFTRRCNFSSWYVEPRFRTYAPVLSSQAINKKDVTYLTLTPAVHTWPILEAQGFSRFTSGRFVVSAFGPLRRAVQPTRVVGCSVNPDTHFEPFERDLLLAHSEYGCISIWCVTPGRAYPFVFLPLVVKRLVPCVLLLYCREIEDFVKFSSQIGLYLGLRGKLFVMINSNGPIPGLAGKYFDGINPKYYKGPIAPRLGDLAYTELAMLPRIFKRSIFDRDL